MFPVLSYHPTRPSTPKAVPKGRDNPSSSGECDEFKAALNGGIKEPNAQKQKGHGKRGSQGFPLRESYSLRDGQGFFPMVFCCRLVEMILS